MQCALPTTAAGYIHFRLNRSRSNSQLHHPATKISQHPLQIIRLNAYRNLSSSSLDDDTPPPPHHVDQLPESPGSPARLLSDGIIVANVIIFILQLASPAVTEAGIKANELIDQGQLWRLVTPAFLHGSPTHLFLNMLSLHSLGPIAEFTCGRERFAAIYLLAAVSGNVASYVGDDLPSLGASGAIFGLAGALVIFFWRNQKLFGSRFNNLQMRLWFIIALNLGSGFLLPQVDEWGHVGGLVGGALAAFLLGPRYEVCRVQGREGLFLIDDPPLEALATPPRKFLK